MEWWSLRKEVLKEGKQVGKIVLFMRTQVGYSHSRKVETSGRENGGRKRCLGEE